MTRSRIIYVLSRIDSARQFEWVAEGLRARGVEIEFVLLNRKAGSLEKYLREKKFQTLRLPLFNKLSFPFLFIALLAIFIVRRPRIIHTHLFEANLLGLLAGWITRVPHRIHTRHHSVIHHNFFKNAVKWDKMSNWLSTAIIAPSRIVSEVLVDLEHVIPKKIHIIHHGFNLQSFRGASVEAKSMMRAKYDLSEDQYPVIGCVARYTEWKGVHFIVQAFKAVLSSYPNATLLLCNAGGDYCTEIKENLSDLPDHSYREIVFEEDMATLYQCFDVFVHVPTGKLDEAFGQVYIEAMAAEVPSVITLSGIANEFVEPDYDAMVVAYGNAGEISEAILFLLSHPEEASNMAKQAAEKIAVSFSMDLMNQLLFDLYIGMANRETQ